jgi:hypothetical protein
MKKTKLIILTLTLLICGVVGFAQQLEMDSAALKYQRDKIFQESPYIFQGTLIKGEPFQTGKGSKVRYSRLIKVTNIFKNTDGKLKLGTVQIIDEVSPIPMPPNDSIPNVPNFKPSEYQAPVDNGVYFCNVYNTTSHKMANDNEPLVLQENYGVGFGMYEIFDLKDITIPHYFAFSAFGNTYRNKEDFYKVMKQYLNITIPDSLLQKKSPIENKLNFIKPIIKIDTSSILNNIHIKSSTANNKTGHSKHIEDVALYLQIANPIITGSSPFFTLSFDILINASDPGYFLDNILMDFAYSPALGTNIAFSLFPNLNPLFYDSTAEWTTGNISAQVFSLNYGSNPDSSAWTRNEIPTAATTIFTFNIPVADCTDTVTLGFTDVGSTALDNFYTENFDDAMGDAHTFFSTDYSPAAPLEYLLCPPLPVITSFPDTIYAGAYYQNNSMNISNMVIKGLNFGPVQGTSNVYFRNADTLFPFAFYPLDAYDIQSWSDTMITLTVPGFVNSPSSHTPGGGVFEVQTSVGTAYSEGVQTGGVYFRYAIQNSSFPTPYTKLRYDLGKGSVASNITFRLDTSITNYPNPMLVPMIKKALADWVCETRVNFVIGDTITLPANYNRDSADGISIIYMVNSFGPTTKTAETSPHGIFCQNSIDPTIKYAVVNDIDIAILRNPNIINTQYFWFFDTLYNVVSDTVPPNGIDLAEIFHHEFGHASGLGHITDPADLMYCTRSPGYYQEWFRRGIRFWDAAGGIDVDTKSALFNNYAGTCSGDNLPLHPSGSCVPGWTTIPTINQNVFDLKIYPNPLNDNLLNIVYSLKQDSPVTFKVLDITGREVFYMNENSSAGEHTDQLHLDNLSIGIYLIKIIIGDTQDTQKLVKIR